MTSLIAGLSDFFIRHPLAQVIAGHIGEILGGLFVLFLIVGCLFLAFGRQSSFYYREGSLSGRCWKLSWLLQAVGVVDLSGRVLPGQRNVSWIEVIVNCVPMALLLFGQMHGAAYHRAVPAERRQAK